MADIVSKENNDAFLSQARLHRTTADTTRQMLSQYKTLHNNMLDELQTSSLSGAIPGYMEWWEAFQSHILNHADLHEQMADHLEKTVTGFTETDDSVQQIFTNKATGF